MLDQWGFFPTTMEQTLLKLIRLDIAKRCQLHGKVVKWQRAEAYGVEREELEQYAEELAADLKEAEEGSLIPAGYFDEGSPIEPDEGRMPNVPTVLNGKNLDDDDLGPTQGEGDQGGGNEKEESDKQDTDEEDKSGEDDGDDMKEELNSENSQRICNDEEYEL